LIDRKHDTSFWQWNKREYQLREWFDEFHFLPDSLCFPLFIHLSDFEASFIGEVWTPAADHTLFVIVAVQSLVVASLSYSYGIYPIIW